MIAKLDEEVGGMMARLSELGLDEDTIILYTSDNGSTYQSPIREGGRQERHNVGMRGQKGSGFEGGIRVPCFIRWTGKLEAGYKVDRFTTLFDLLPTLLDFAGAEPDYVHPLDGQTLYPILMQQGDENWQDYDYFSQHNYALLDYGKPLKDFGEKVWKNSCAKVANYKLVDGKLLFDPSNDPGEQEDLAEQMPEKLEALRMAYLEWFEETTSGRTFPSTPNSVGAPEQKQTRLYYAEQIIGKGWPLDVHQAGAYRVTVDQIQYPVLTQGNKLVLQAGGSEYTDLLDSSNPSVDFVLELPAGEQFLDARVTGKLKPVKWGSHGRWQDQGFRMVYVEPAFE